MRVVDASPLIDLARVSLLELLRGPYGRIVVIVPAVVLDEVVRGEQHDPTGELVEAAARDWLTVVPTPTLYPDIDRARIDAGETDNFQVHCVHSIFVAVKQFGD